MWQLLPSGRDRDALKNGVHKKEVNTFYTISRAIIHQIVIAGNGQSVCWKKAVLVDYIVHGTKSVKLHASVSPNQYTWDIVHLPKSVSAFKCASEILLHINRLRIDWR